MKSNLLGSLVSSAPPAKVKSDTQSAKASTNAMLSLVMNTTEQICACAAQKKASLQSDAAKQRQEQSSGVKKPDALKKKGIEKQKSSLTLQSLVAQLKHKQQQHAKWQQMTPEQHAAAKKMQSMMKKFSQPKAAPVARAKNDAPLAPRANTHKTDTKEYDLELELKKSAPSMSERAPSVQMARQQSYDPLSVAVNTRSGDQGDADSHESFGNDEE